VFASIATHESRVIVAKNLGYRQNSLKNDVF
jgi:hypothetical protein